MADGTQWPAQLLPRPTPHERSQATEGGTSADERTVKAGGRQARRDGHWPAEPVSGKTFTACFSLVRPYGDLVSTVESPWEEEAVSAMHDRNLRVSFTWMPAPSVFGWPEHRERQTAILEQAAAHFDTGDLGVVVGATFPLERAAEAHRALEAGEVVGKAVLTVG